MLAGELLAQARYICKYLLFEVGEQEIRVHSTIPSLSDVCLHCDTLSLSLEDILVGVFHRLVICIEVEASFAYKVGCDTRIFG